MSPTKLQTGFQFLTKDFLRFWMVDISREGHRKRSAPPRRDTRHTGPGVHGNWGWDGEGRSCAAPEESGLVKLLVLWPAQTGKAQNAGPTKFAPLWGTQEPEPERLRPGKCTQLRAHSLESNLEPEQCRQGNHTSREQGQIQCGQNTASTPHTCQWYLFAVPLPPHSTTEQANLKKRPPPPTCVRAEIRHWRDLQNRSQINKD